MFDYFLWSKLVTLLVFGNSLWSCMRPISEAKKMTSNSLELFMWTAWGEFQWYEKDYSWCQLLLWFLIGGYFGEYVGTWLLFSQFSMDHQMFWFCQEKSLFMVLRPIYKESLTFLRKIATQLIVKKAIHFADYCIL